MPDELKFLEEKVKKYYEKVISAAGKNEVMTDALGEQWFVEAKQEDLDVKRAINEAQKSKLSTE